MITPELLDFIEAELKAGQTPDGLFRLLKDGGGWTVEDVNEALSAVEKRKRPVSVAEMRAHSAPATHIAGRPPLLHIPETKKPEPAPAPVITPAPALSVGEMMRHDTPASIIPPSHQPAPTVVPVSAPASDSTHTPASAPAPVVSVTLPPHTVPAPVPPPTQKVPEHPISLVPTLAPAIPAGATSAHATSIIPASLASAQAEVAADASHGLSLRVPVSKSKKILILAGVLVFLALFGVGGYFVIKGAVPKPDKTFATMYASIPGIQTFRYAGETTLNFSGIVTDALKANLSDGYTGSAKVAFKYDGRADIKKGIDGVHQFGITADLHSGTSVLSVNSTIELRIIGDTYYIKVTNPPEIKDIDLSRLNTYWIAISPADIAKRFGGAVADQKDTYGAFGGGASTTPTMRGIISSYPPFDALDRIGEEQLLGAQTIHYRFQGNPDNLLSLIKHVIATVTNAPWQMKADEEANWKALLASVAGDIWIDSASYLPRKIVFRQPLKGTVSGIAVDGTLDVEQNYSEYNGVVAVSVPRPVMTYQEFSEDINRQSKRVKATGDERRIFDAGDIVSALEVYRANNDNNYPPTLDVLVTGGLLPAVPVDPDGGAYLYAAFLDKTKTTKKYLCSAATSTCAFFHLGVTLASSTAEVLKDDSDLLTETVAGADTKGCSKEANKSCYDLTPKTP